MVVIMLDEQQQDNFWDTYQTKAEDRIIRDAEHSLVDAGIVPPPPDPFQTWAQSPEGQDVAAKVEEQKAKLSVFQQSFNKTAEEPAMPKPTEAGNIDLNNRPVIKNADGTISTVRSMSFNEGNGEILIPTTAEDGSRILSDDEAIQQYHQTGKHLGKFSTPEDATAYAQQLHEKQAQQYGQDESGQAGVPDTTATAAPAGKTLPQPSPISFPGGKAPVWLRNNNPGNIRASSTSFQSYGTMEEGLSAQKDLLLRYQDKHGLNTVTGIVSRYAPPNENKTQKYINTVSKDMGVSPDQPLDLHDPNTLFALQKSMVRVETGRKAALTASNDQELADVLKVPGYSGGSNGTGGIPGFGQAPVVQARNQRTPLEATGDIFSEAWQRTKDYGSKALGNTYAGMAGFFRTLDDLSSDVAAATGTDKGGVFQALMEQSDYWAKHFLGQVKYDDYMTNVVGGILGSGPGMMEFAMGPAFAGLKGYTEGGLPTAAKSAATWGIMKGILAATNALPMALRAPTTGAAFSGQALAEGVTAPGQLAEAFGVGMGMGIATPQTRTPWNQRLPGVDYDAMSDANIMNLHRAMMNGETDQATYEVAKRLVKDIPGLSDRVQVEVVPALMLASKELSSQYGISGEGKIVGSHTPNQEVEPGVFRDLVKLYDGHMPAVDLLHEIGGHNIVERLLPQFPQVEQELRQFWKDSGAEARGVDFAEFGADEVARSYLSQGLFMGQGETPWGEFVGRVKGVFDRTLDRLGVLPESRAPQNFDQLVQQALQEGRTFKGIGAPGPREQDRVRPVSESKNWEEVGRWGFGDEDVPFEVQDKLQSIEPDVIDNNLPPPLKAKSLGINYSKINSEEDIAGLINKVETVLAPDIDAARRYERSHDTTAQAASDLGMTEADLLARMRGEGWNAEKTYAARVILNASAEDLMRRARDIKDGANSDEALAAFRARMETHAALQAHVAGLRAEAGRALNQWKMLAKVNDIDPRLTSQFNQADLSRMNDQLGGRRSLIETANVIAESAERGNVSMHQISSAVNAARNRTFKDWFVAYYYNNMLCGPITHAANIIGNTMTAGMVIPERYVASFLGLGFKKVRDATGLSWGWLSSGDGDVNALEAKAMAFATVQSQAEALKLAWSAVKTGESKFGGSKIDYNPQFKPGGSGLMSGKLPEMANKAADAAWTALGIPGRMLGAEDDYFKFLAYRQEVNARAYRQAAVEGREGDDLVSRARELADNPTEEISKAAFDFAMKQTFQQDMGEAMTALQNFTNKSLFGKIVLPFVKTPYNVLQYSLDRTPVAFIKKSFWDDFQSGGARRDLALARVALGTTIMGLAMIAAHSGNLTGDGPSEPTERRAWLKVYQPNSIKIGGEWYSYARLEPISTIMSLAVNTSMVIREWDELGQGKDPMSIIAATGLAAAKTITNKTFMTGVSRALNAVTNPETYGPKMLQSFMASMVPYAALMRAIIPQADPEVKAVEDWVDAMKAEIPGLSSTLPPKRDVWGDPYQVHAAGEGIYLRWLSPIKVQTAEVRNIDKELLRLEWGPTLPPKTQSFQGIPIKLTPQEYDRMVELSTQVMRGVGADGVGRTMADHLDRLIRTPEYRQLDDEQKKAALNREIQVLRQAAQIRLMKENPRLQALMTLGLREKGRNQ
jgi:hypothetical protein